MSHTLTHSGLYLHINDRSMSFIPQGEEALHHGECWIVEQLALTLCVTSGCVFYHTTLEANQGHLTEGNASLPHAATCSTVRAASVDEVVGRVRCWPFCSA